MAAASSTAAPKDMLSPAPAAGAAPEKKIILHSITVRINSAAMATIFILSRFLMPMTIHSTISAPTTRHHIHAPPEKMPAAARELSYIIMAVQPTSWVTFSAANSRQPFRPKLSFTVSMALCRVRAPIRPAKYIMVQPMTWPSSIASRPFCSPSGAKYVPVIISARETPAPNHMRAFANTEVFFVSIFAPPQYSPPMAKA